MKATICRWFVLGLFFWTAFSAQAFTTVVIDAGHGGQDRGGLPGQRVAEKAVALDVAIRLEAILRRAGLRTIMTRRNDVFIPLSTRVAIANRTPNAIFVSIHFNAAEREGAAGIETYYYSSKSYALAARIHRQVLSVAATEDRRVRSRGFYVIRNTRIPSVLCELGFLTNGVEARKAQSPRHRQNLANAVAAGILEFRRSGGR